MKMSIIPILVVVAVLLYSVFFWFSLDYRQDHAEGVLMTDTGKLYPTYVEKVVKETQVEDLQRVLAEARLEGLKVSISGKQHSQGGHTYYDGAVVLDMTSFNEILSFDKEQKIIRVQSGVTWEQIQAYINPHGLAVKTMQSSNIFTIGGTLSTNVHGRDLEKTVVIETVKSFRLLLADGQIIHVSRESYPELFRLVIGGYGLFGVILDVDLELVENEIYETKAKLVDYRDFPTYFKEHVKQNPDVALFIGRSSIAPSSLLDEIIVWTWEQTDATEQGIYDLLGEENVARDKFIFGLSRTSDWGKEFRWNLQKGRAPQDGGGVLVSRNNAMRPPTAPLKLFVDYYSPDDVDLVQEYFVPTRNFVGFLDGLRKVIQEEDVNILGFTIRYLEAQDEAFLSYAPDEEAFALIVFANYGLSEEGQDRAERATQRMVDLAIAHEGTYYLTYQLYPSQEQIRAAYPEIDAFFEKKRVYDPDEIFMSKFYERYALGKSADEL